VRSADVELLALAAASGALIALVAALGPRRRVGLVAVLVAVASAKLADRAFVDALPTELDGSRALWLGVAVVAFGVGIGASRLPPRPAVAQIPATVWLAAGSVVGVWAGVPETSPALLAAGVLVGATLSVVARRACYTAPALVVLAVAPAAAAGIGAAGDAHAALGGLLCSATFVLLAVGPQLGRVGPSALALAASLNLLAGLVAARQLAIGRDWDGALPWVALTLALSAGAAGALRRGARSTA
jgi:hypothetical protein